MIHVEDWAEIRRLHRAEGLSARAVARQLGISRNTVLRALASERAPQYRRAPKGSAVDAVEPAIRELLKATPTMPATVIAERIGWNRGMTVLKERVRELRPAYLPVDPVSRTVYQPGELAQCDLWFPDADIPLGYGQSGRPPVLVIVSGYSRVITARMLPSRTTGDLIDGHWRLLADGWQAVPKMLVWDNEAGVGKGRLTSEFAAFAGLLAVKIHLCRPRDPEAKGLVERANGYLETSFLPGRTFTGPDGFNAQLTAWLQIANRRMHRSIAARPVDRWEADRAAMLAVPPVTPPHWWRFSTRLGRDHYIRVDTNDYSVHPRAIGRTVMVRSDTEEVTVTCGDDIVARHARCWARHQSLTDPEHAAAAAVLRGEVIHQQAARAATARAAMLAPDSLGIEVEQRELGTYDRMFTLIEGGAGKEDT
ncbi:IS21 family transposase [Streptomyces antarcticus]|uniref:IS21 family transposase n=2 Tax=Streptomyces TaxID=1883 RepID=UPI00227207A8|nr:MULTISPECIES: IS21 family transposase [unclassified Streptomyces]MCY0947265.1 IS21 family transposase [Streptomyces sp. H34-AA3]MCZ4086498.1 IS21 family transposase [Streptomyces sp. H34-S5]